MKQAFLPLLRIARLTPDYSNPVMAFAAPANRMIPSAAMPCGKKTPNQVGASKSASPCSELARLGKAAYTSARRGRDFVAGSFFERETDGSEGEANGFETN